MTRSEYNKLLSNLGFTSEEILALGKCIELANDVLALPILHDMDKEEFCNAIHIIQDKLMARPIMRKLKG